MTKEEKLHQKFRSRALARGNALLFSRDVVLEVIDECERLGLIILGMDFFQDEGGNPVSLLNAADYSALSGEPDAPRRSASEARRLLAGGLPDNAAWAELILAGKDEDAKRREVARSRRDDRTHPAPGTRGTVSASKMDQPSSSTN